MVKLRRKATGDVLDSVDVYETVGGVLVTNIGDLPLTYWEIVAEDDPRGLYWDSETQWARVGDSDDGMLKKVATVPELDDPVWNFHIPELEEGAVYIGYDMDGDKFVGVWGRNEMSQRTFAGRICPLPPLEHQAS